MSNCCPNYIIVMVVPLKNLIKTINQKDPIKMVRSKSTCLEWHFCQVGPRGKKTIWGRFFDQNSQ
jgi:hypothetical protein